MRLFMVSFFITIFVFFTQAFAQIPNGDFESWTAGNPTGWLTDNAVGVATPITQTSDAHGGSSAVRGEVLNFFGNPYPGYIYNYGNAFPISQRYAQLNGYYKLSPQGNDRFYIVVWFYSKGQLVAENYGQFGAASSYTQFSVPLIYLTADIPDSANIFIAAGEDTSQTSQNANIGTVFYVDDLSFSGTATSVKDNTQLLSFRLNQNYPNPLIPLQLYHIQFLKAVM